MKIYFCVATIFTILVLANSGPAAKEHVLVRQQAKECAKETGAPIQEPFEPLSFIDRKGKCFFACILKKDGILIDGKLTIENAMKILEESPPVDCINKANEEKDECEVVGTFHKCVMEKHRELSKE